MTPTPEEIRQFLDTWRRLCEFEGCHRQIRHWGMFGDDEKLPIPACVKVQEWLEGLCEDKNKPAPA